MSCHKIAKGFKNTLLHCHYVKYEFYYQIEYKFPDNFRNTENNSGHSFIKIQVFLEKSSIKVTKYLKANIDGTRLGPQTSEWARAKG